MQTEHSTAIDSLQGGLLPHHLAQLHASGVSDAVIAARLYMSVLATSDARLLRCRGFSRAQCAQIPGLLMPLWGLDGKELENPGYESKLPTDDPTYLAQYRPDVPRLGQDGRVIKYELPPKCGARLDSNPAGRALLLDPALPLWITEGVKKSDCLVSHGIPAITLLGVAMWRSLADWPLLMGLVKRRDVVICFDSDVATNPHVARQETLLAQQLLQRGAQVRLARLVPDENGEKVGIDDFLGRGGQIGDIPMIDVAPEAPLPHSITLRRSAQGKPLPLTSNLESVLAQDPTWQGVLAFDVFAQRHMLLSHPPFLPEALPFTPRPLRDSDAVAAKIWFERSAYDVYPSTTGVFEALIHIAEAHPYHPVQDYLHALTWDHTPRARTWLSVYMQADASSYTSAVGQAWLTAAIARVMAPGCKADCALVLEGEQGTRKTSVLELLAVRPEWYTDSLIDLHSKDAMEALRGKWIVELAELSAMRRSDVEGIKGFLSRREDHYRPAYGRLPASYPRSCVFAGSTNRGEYLQDDTGNRRFWPVRVGDTNLDALALARDQLWAEALTLYAAHVPWWLTPDEEVSAKAEQAQRLELDPWSPSIEDYVAGLPYIQAHELLTSVLQIDRARQTKADSNRVGRILRQLGWTRKDVHQDGQHFKRFAPPAPIAPISHPSFSEMGATLTTQLSESYNTPHLTHPTIYIYNISDDNYIQPSDALYEKDEKLSAIGAGSHKSLKEGELHSAPNLGAEGTAPNYDEENEEPPF